MNLSRINVRLEGGVGDLILASRFLLAVREMYPDSFVSVFISNDANKKYNGFFARHWGYLFDGYEDEVEINDREFQITSQFGQEKWTAAFENIKEEWRTKMLDCDRFYNFHLDALDFTSAKDIAWQKFLKCVPRPENVEVKEIIPSNTIILNLYAREGHSSAISKENANAIIGALRGSNNVIVLAPSEDVKESFYSEHKDLVRVTDLEETLGLISQCALGVSLDSGIRCMFYSFGKPCLTLCSLVKAPFQVPTSHVIRWYPWTEHMLPVDMKPLYVALLAENILENPLCGLYPNIEPKNIDNVLIKRKYA